MDAYSKWNVDCINGFMLDMEVCWEDWLEGTWKHGVIAGWLFEGGEWHAVLLDGAVLPLASLRSAYAWAKMGSPATVAV